MALRLSFLIFIAFFTACTSSQKNQSYKPSSGRTAASENEKVDSLKDEQELCESRKSKILKMRSKNPEQPEASFYPTLETMEIEVPENWSSPEGDKISLFVWRRVGADPTYPPLLFIHGGVGGNSGPALRFNSVLDQYPGDFISLDLRGEGCSKTLNSNLHPAAYKNFRARSVVQDLDFIRKKIYGEDTKWRIYGHSRGAALVQYYLEMFPLGLESASLHGMLAAGPNSTFTRAKSFYKVSQQYLALYPEDKKKVQKIRQSIKPDQCWPMLDDIKVCGPAAMDVLAFDLTGKPYWKDLHASIGKMISDGGQLDFKAIDSEIGGRLKYDIYGQFGYIMGTNAVDFGNPNFEDAAKLSSNPVYKNNFLAEVRYVNEALRTFAPKNWKSGFDPIDFKKIRDFLRSHPKFSFRMFASASDPIGWPENYEYEKKLFGPLVKLTIFENSGHEGGYSEQEIHQWNMRPPNNH